MLGNFYCARMTGRIAHAGLAAHRNPKEGQTAPWLERAKEPSGLFLSRQSGKIGVDLCQHVVR